MKNMQPKYIVPKCVSCSGNEFDEKFIRMDQCERIKDDGTCNAYVDPNMKWRGGRLLSRCPLASHYRPDLGTPKGGKRRVGQQKQRKQ